MLSSTAVARPSSEINVTPLVDVALVLLIIFMVATPLLRHGYEVALPRSSSEKGTRQVVTVALNGSGRLTLNGAEVRKEDLRWKLDQLFDETADREVLFDGEDDAGQKDVMEVLDVIRASGGRIGIVLAR